MDVIKALKVYSKRGNNNLKLKINKIRFQTT